MGRQAGEYPLEFASGSQLMSQDITSAKRKGNRTFLEDFPKAGGPGVTSPQAIKSQMSLGRNSVL